MTYGEYLTTTYTPILTDLEHPGLNRLLLLEEASPLVPLYSLQDRLANSRLSALELSQPMFDLDAWLQAQLPDDFVDIADIADLEKNYEKKYSKSEGYKATKAELEKLIPNDPVKRQILLGIAAHESGYNPNAKNSSSSAYGLFQFIKSNQLKYGYGKSIASQVAAASKLYDDNLAQLNLWIGQYGNRGLSLYKMMNGMWFNPGSMRNYLAKGSSNFRDALGTSFNKVLARNRQGGTLLILKIGGKICNLVR